MFLFNVYDKFPMVLVQDDFVNRSALDLTATILKYQPSVDISVTVFFVNFPLKNS